eukprot:g24151.t1
MAAVAETRLGSQRFLRLAQIHGGGSKGGEFGPSMGPGSVNSGRVDEVGLKRTHGGSGVEFRPWRYPAESVASALARSSEDSW